MTTRRPQPTPGSIASALGKPLWDAVRRILPDGEEESRPESLAFDREHGVETARFASWHAYEPSPPSVVEAVLAAVIAEVGDAGHDASACTFIDIGSGKGRVLMLASRCGFARVVGVDPAAKLCRAAEQNLRQWREQWPDGAPIEVRCEDACRMEWPDGALVLYLYNPFDAKSLDRMLRNLPRRAPVWLAYVNPLHVAPLERHGFAQVSEATPFDHYTWRLYRR